jgi:hypothetical protein
MINFILKYSTYQNSDKKIHDIFFNISFVDFYHLAKF